MQFFRSENFDVFYNLGFEKISRSPIRAPTSAKKNPISEEKIFFSEVNFSISEVEKHDFEQNKRRETLYLGLSPLR